MNTVNIIGRLVKDPEVRLTPNQTKYCSFCIAVDSGKDSNGQKRAYFFNCVAWQKTAENIARFFSKGHKIAITGMLTSRSFETNNGEKRTVVEILVNTFDFCNDNTVSQGQQAASENEAPAAPTSEQIDIPDSRATQEVNELPFEI